MIEKIEKFIIKLIFGDDQDKIRNPDFLDSKLKNFLLKCLLCIVGIPALAFGIKHLLDGEIMLCSVELFATVVCLTLYVLLLFNIKQTALIYAAMIIFTLLCGAAIYFEVRMLGGSSTIATLISLIFPLVLFYFLGLKGGLVFSLLLFAWIIYCRYDFFFAGGFEQGFHIRTTGGYLGICFLGAVREITKTYTNRNIRSLLDEIRFENEQITMMKDNLKTGIFLIDRQWQIQPGFSLSAMSIFDESDLANINFVDMLSASLKGKELSTLKDFFEMVITNSYDKEMLDDINPLQHFIYINRTNREEKDLRCTFSAVTNPDGETFLLVTADDISAEIAARNQMNRETDERLLELDDIMDILHLDAKVIADFVEDTEYEFNQINKILKENKDSSGETSKRVITFIYQSIHAIKGDATILGLRRFSHELHEFEDRIRELRDSEKQASFSDILSLTFSIDRLMKTNDGLKAVIDKISAFSKNIDKVGETAAFVKMIETAAQKVAAATGKRINFIAEDIDDRIMAKGPRREMKDILVQITRNAVYHGIELPADRKAAGKNETGNITLTMKVNDKERTVQIQLADDGKGINYKNLAKKAESLKLIDNAETADKAALINTLFAPGFSTTKLSNMFAGRGVGLSLVKNIVTDLNGNLSVKFLDGAGAKFTIDLPFKEDVAYTRTAKHGQQSMTV